MKLLPSRLLVVTERGAGAEASRLPTTLDAVLGAGPRWVWFRERDLPAEVRRGLGHDVVRVVRGHGGILTVGGDARLAAELGADGVHLPGGTTTDDIARARATLPGGLLGVSAHGLREVEAAVRGGADYVTLSPIFASASKPGYGPALGLDALRVAAACGLPIVALGGMDPDGIRRALAAGAAGVAVMGGIMRAPDTRRAAQAHLAAAVEAP